MKVSGKYSVDRTQFYIFTRLVVPHVKRIFQRLPLM
jgi:hypothetical protein